MSRLFWLRVYGTQSVFEVRCPSKEGDSSRRTYPGSDLHVARVERRDVFKNRVVVEGVVEMKADPMPRMPDRLPSTKTTENGLARFRLESARHFQVAMLEG